MSDQFYVGLDVTGFEDNGRRPAVASVTLQVDGQRVVTAGNYDSGGMDLYALCPYRKFYRSLAVGKTNH